jgi:uncharacterized FlgJ-related protein
MQANQIDRLIINKAMSEGFEPAAAKIIAAQARHETGNYTSRVLQENNNLFGYKWVGQSGAFQGTPAPASEGGPKYYAKYLSLVDSVAEITAWLKRRQQEGRLTRDELNTPAGYAAAIKRPPFAYYQDSQSNYTRALQKALTEVEKNAGTGIVNPANGVIILLAISLLIFWKFKQ